MVPEAKPATKGRGLEPRPIYMGTWGAGSQWCNRLPRTDGPGAGFVLGKGKSEKGVTAGAHALHHQVGRERKTSGFARGDGPAPSTMLANDGESRVKLVSAG